MRLGIDRFTGSAQDLAMRSTREILLRYSHNQVDVEHLLLALLEQPEGVVSEIMIELGADVDLFKRRLDEILRASPKASIDGGGALQIPITLHARHVFEEADKEASGLEDATISTEHIFLAIASERGTPTDRLLRDNGVTKQRIYDAIKEIRK